MYSKYDFKIFVTEISMVVCKLDFRSIHIKNPYISSIMLCQFLLILSQSWILPIMAWFSIYNAIGTYLYVIDYFYLSRQIIINLFYNGHRVNLLIHPLLGVSYPGYVSFKGVKFIETKYPGGDSSYRVDFSQE